MNWTEEVITNVKETFGYTDEEMKLFLENPKNEVIVSKALALRSKAIVVEVVESHGCMAQHKVGDRFYFEGVNLLTKQCPEKICISALSEMDRLVCGVFELFMAGVDPNKMIFNRAGCWDVGVRCGGWGNIVMEVKVEKRKKVKTQK
jgi:uncharacterized repeat protein (TIGR04076 family)